MGFPPYLFLYIAGTSARTLRFEWCKFDRPRAQVEEQGSPAKGALTTRPRFTGSCTHLAKDPTERTGREPSSDPSSQSSVFVTDGPD